MLTSQLFSGSQDLQDVSDGVRTIEDQEESDSVALIQEALLAIGYTQPAFGVDDIFSGETVDAIVDFKQSRGLSNTDPDVDAETIDRLDFEMNYLEGSWLDAFADDTALLARDPWLAGIAEQQLGLSLTEKLTEFFEFGDRMCFRVSFVLSPAAAVLVGRMAEGVVKDDFCRLQAPCTSADFFDLSPSSSDYTDFLLREHPDLDAAELGGLGSLTRPDILRHRPAQSAWYEIKPLSISGAIAARIKNHEIVKNYARVGLPYTTGTSYTPTEFITLGTFFTPEGENLRVVLHLMRRAPGLVFWEICVEGDYVLYFNRVRLTAGILALMVACAILLIPAAEAAGVVAALTALAEALGVALPVLSAL